MKKALVIQHVAFEDLGSLQPVLRELGFAIETHAAATADFAQIDPLDADLWVVLGGPIGVYEGAFYPFLDKEVALLRERLAQRKPTLGICLGAQLLAAALGAEVYPGNNGKEIGWSRLHPAAGADSCPALRALVDAEAAVLHWHGDTFDLPPVASLLASSDQYPHQAFAVGRHLLALQFHPEVTAQGLENWYVGHACELAHAKIDVRELRSQAARYSSTLEAAAKKLWHEWLASACGAKATV